MGVLGAERPWELARLAQGRGWLETMDLEDRRTALLDLKRRCAREVGSYLGLYWVSDAWSRWRRDTRATHVVVWQAPDSRAPGDVSPVAGDLLARALFDGGDPRTVLDTRIGPIVAAHEHLVDVVQLVTVGCLLDRGVDPGAARGPECSDIPAGQAVHRRDAGPSPPEVSP